MVEHIPWGDGQLAVACAMMEFLACWTRRLSWRETARAFRTGWDAMCLSVESLVR